MRIHAANLINVLVGDDSGESTIVMLRRARHLLAQCDAGVASNNDPEYTQRERAVRAWLNSSSFDLPFLDHEGPLAIAAEEEQRGGDPYNRGA